MNDNTIVVLSLIACTLFGIAFGWPVGVGLFIFCLIFV